MRKTKGFSWGAAGVSTALFTGVAMSDVIRRAKPFRPAKYVCMEGADELVRLYMLTHASYLTFLAEWSLWHLGQVELGYG